MSLYQKKAKRLGWTPPDGLSDDQLNESAVKFLSNLPVDAKLVQKDGLVYPEAPHMLLVKSPTFFMRRNSKGGVTDEIAVALVDQVMKKFSSVLLIAPVSMQEVLAGLPRQGLVICWVDRNAVAVSIEKLVQLLKVDYRLNMTLPANRRTISWLNIEQCIHDDRVVTVGEHDHAKIQLEAERDIGMKEMAAIRANNDWN